MLALCFDPPRARWPLVKAAGLLSRTAFAGVLGGLRLRDVPAPTLPGPDWVRLDTRLGGICGTDLALVALRNHPATFLQRFASFPAVLGHENVATIAEVGPAVRDWQPGRRVCVEPALSCAPRGIAPVCPACEAGQTSLCINVDRGKLPPGVMIGLNSRTGGSWSPSFVAHVSQLHAVPDDIPDEVAVLTDPIACAVHAVLRRPPRPGEQVLVSGSGIIAIGVLAAIRALGCDNRVVAVVRHPFQADTIRSHGATEARVHPRGWSAEQRFDDVATAIDARRVAGRFGNQTLVGGFDLTFDCTGSGAGLADAMKWTRARGTVVIAGTPQIAVVDTTPAWFTELEITGCNGRQIESVDGRRRHTYEVVFDWVRAGRLNLAGLLTHRFALSDYRAAFEALVTRSRGYVIKAAFVPR